MASTLDARLVDDMKTAMKAKQDARVSAIRFVRSVAHNREIELGRPLTDDELLDVIRKQARQRQDAIDQFAAASRADLVAKERADLDVIVSYLPKQLDRAAIEQVARSVIDELGATSPADMRRVMPALMKRLGDSADGRVASDVAGALLRGGR